MPHGEVTITLQDVEVLLGLPIDGEAITGSTQKEWDNVCNEFLGFRPVNDQRKQIHGQRILIQRLLEAVANPLLPNVTEDQLHKYARCYILALLEDTIFMDKSGNRVHLTWVQQLEDLRNPRSACLAWLYRELCRASDKKANHIGGCLLLVQYWAWARFSYLCPTVEHGLLVGAYGPPVRGPLSLKLLGYLQSQQVGRNAYQRHLLVRQGGTNMDTKLGQRHLTKDMQDLHLIIRDGVRFKKAESKSTNDTSRDQAAAPIVPSSTTSNVESNSSTSKLEEELKVASRLRKFSFNDLKLATRNFRPESLLGEGGFGCIQGVD